MPSNNTEQIKIWSPAHRWLKQISAAYKERGESSKSMTALASEAILSIPMPNGKNQPSAEAQLTLLEFPPKPVATDPNRHYSIDDYSGYESEIPDKDLAPEPGPTSAIIKESEWNGYPRC